MGSLIFLLGDFIYLLFFLTPQKNSLEPSWYQFTAKVVNLDKKLTGWNVLVEPQDLKNYSGQVLIYAPLYPEYNYGDVLAVSCRLQTPEPIVNNQGGEFAYDKYLAKDKIYAVCFRPTFKVIGQFKDFNFYLYRVKKYFWENLDVHLVEPASSLAKAFLLANQKEISKATRQDFSRTGLSHVVAISGLHMAIIMVLLEKFFIGLGLSRKKSFSFICLVILFYLLLIGFISPAIRSALMIFMVLAGTSLGRNTSALYSLLLSGDILLLLKPAMLLYDISFQLSFLAILGMVLYANFFETKLFWITNRLKIRAILAVTLSAQVFTWPLIVYYFGTFSLIAPVANFFILPFLPFILVLSLLLAVVGIWPVVASLVAWPLFILLKIMTEITKFLADLPWAYLQVNYFPLSFLVGSLVVTTLLTFILKPQGHAENLS
jgi:competence protein ComEC